ncbi:MAG: NAD(P)/FAD-dependent oxidoreductase [Beijerinckiaceae bacterium]|nr:NAD(P)/FAD-dependent oxidoreductase [Beijerinckiaceae bacterium]
MMDTDVIVVGAGVVGLAVARECAIHGLSVIVLEQASHIGSETSSRNSEVIHSGIYYPTGSLKARLCIEGRRLLYPYLDSHNVPHRQIGKLIVATDEGELEGLGRLLRQGEINGCDDLRIIEGPAVRRLEPMLASVGGMLSPCTGILDSHSYMLALQGDAEDHGAAIAFQTPFLSARVGNGYFAVRTGGRELAELRTRFLINAGALHASCIARAIEGLDPSLVPETLYAKGNYFRLAGRAPFSRLIYPAPQTHGLGIHLTLDMAGSARFGPDVQWIEKIDYKVDETRIPLFQRAIRRYWPALPDDALVPGYSGIRPKISGPGNSAPDFRIDGPEVHGLDGLVNLFGIESPGLTSSLAIATETLRRLTGSAIH